MGLTEPSSEDPSSDESGASAVEDQRHTRGKKRAKSGKSAKISSRVVNPQIWPHSELTLGYVSKDVKYDDLTIEKFVAGYAAILALPSLSSREKRERIEHLNALMYLATVYEWSAVRSYHAAVLMEIERGRRRWGDSFATIENRSFAGCSKKSSLSYDKVDTKRSAVLFSREFNKSNCSHGKDHFAMLRGERKCLSHICAACWVKDRLEKSHPESAAECPHKNDQE